MHAQLTPQSLYSYSFNVTSAAPSREHQYVNSELTLTKSKTKGNDILDLIINYII